jgi:hypothetical protein
MEDGRERRRVVLTGRGDSGEDVRLVFQLTDDGYIAVSSHRRVKLDPLAVSKAVENLRYLQAIALRGIRWHIQ